MFCSNYIKLVSAGVSLPPSPVLSSLFSNLNINSLECNSTLETIFTKLHVKLVLFKINVQFSSWFYHLMNENQKTSHCLYIIQCSVYRVITKTIVAGNRFSLHSSAIDVNIWNINEMQNCKLSNNVSLQTLFIVKHVNIQY